ncbi:MAG: VRR-NUC domain-containing protein [Epsilonproteobacteria bacterium]|nr:VRR-NUC domain-containing protein [Campylobacterota bacterium]
MGNKQKIVGRKVAKPSEHEEQSKFVRWCRLNKIPVFSIPNGFWLPIKNKVIAAKYVAKLKREGLSPGVPDLFIPIPNAGYHGLFIEMKVGGGYLRDEQKQWIRQLNERGYKAVVCYSANEAMKELEEYLGASE